MTSSARPDYFEPPNSKELPKGSLAEIPRHVLCEPKLDGVRALAHCLPDGSVVIKSRRLNKAGEYSSLEDKVPHVRRHAVLCALGLQGYTVFDGELIAPVERDSLTATMSVLGSNPDKAIARQDEIGELRYYVFDVAYWKGEDVTNKTLRERRALFSNYFSTGPVVGMPQTYIKSDSGRLEYLEAFISAGGEGIMFKDPDSKYFDRKGWVKVKGTTTVDAIVTGWVPGKGKYEGTIGALKVSATDGATGELRELCTVAPGTDETRRWLFESLGVDGLDHLELVVELEAQAWTTGGKLRHPRIVRYRKDKTVASVVDFDGSLSRVV